MNLIATIALGFFLGMRHATDADHVVAVSTIVSRQRSLRAAAPIGVLWGIGHTVTIFAVGGAILVFGLVIPPRVGLSMEMLVAVMLVALGVINTLRGRPHGGAEHRSSMRPLGVGLVHGLAGSAAVALLVLGSIRNPAWGVAYLVVFGVGTIAGMLLITTALAVPVVVASARFEQLHRVLSLGTGLASIVWGVFLAYDIGFVHGLFTSHPDWTPQ
jgi:high-affinity nickel-transport protein